MNNAPNIYTVIKSRDFETSFMLLGTCNQVICPAETMVFPK